MSTRIPQSLFRRLHLEVRFPVATLAVGSVRSPWLAFPGERAHRQEVSNLVVELRGKLSSSHELLNAPEASEVLTCDDGSLSNFQTEPAATKEVGQRRSVHIDQLSVIVAAGPFACLGATDIWHRWRRSRRWSRDRCRRVRKV